MKLEKKVEKEREKNNKNIKNKENDFLFIIMIIFNSIVFEYLLYN